ncbi:hypothetical protein H257_09546 [Aphanomyces astaci]|uniref:Uncharacterized protein n=2 Tax=Aphanomyces astaci TaxID=112090 RepID=W4GBV6_APHAT|nr:hypothetical protein H257_09546 [Aphanomyces astaci]ETV76544.1 hypothetical protein H257_09546 [Aphanomyces astaci]RHY02551.1 hypothetical protein DYB25_006203 [Aphanomyces astaci]RHY08564.1 hypothetical protein DYB36_006019 [Aphanomyces astaci]RHY51970.1 hypothetical protein DYB38_004376 [Aphanomyces astaci]RHY55604.1 hypothetical protein DYB30_005989 [Aphanomyces astaci]|eukprot:XP_009834089.1 hypothetical protein H257_09546 [Aphanomyces astaci]
MEILSSVARLGIGFPLRVASDLSVIPSIAIMKQNQRHFEMFIGIFHVVVSCLANAADVYERTTDAPLFLTTDQWNGMLDVLWLSFLYLLVVHLLSIKNENVNIVLRYAGFSLAWILKLKDGPATHTYSLLMVLAGFSAVVLRRNLFADKYMLPLRKREMATSVALALFCTTIFLYAFDIPIDGAYIRAAFYCCLGAFFYFGWKCVPVGGDNGTSKKWDDCDVVSSEFI